jgi:hypothetical protein
MRRKTNSPRSAPFSLRLTPQEKHKLESAASGIAIAAYIKSTIFAEHRAARSTRGKAPVKDHRLLAEVLARLGDSRIANNLNQLAYAANIGVLDGGREVSRLLNEAYQEVRAIRALLLKALGQKGSPKGKSRKGRVRAFRLRDAFAEAAAEDRP